jgi:hypothetical protein
MVFSVIPVVLFVSTVSVAQVTGEKSEALKTYPVHAEGCNATVFAQIPDMPDLFIGRLMNRTDPQDGCKGRGWSLVLLNMDWATHRLRLVRTILQTPVPVLNGMRIDSAYDPYVVKFNGEYWVAFECAGKGIYGGATCMGPFDPRQPDNGMDISRTYVIVQGLSSEPDDIYHYSASDPKLLTFHNRLYLYWSSIKWWKPPGGYGVQWLSIATRGMELRQEAGGQRLLWGVGAMGPVDAYDPSKNVEVWSGDTDDVRSNQTVDMFSIISLGGVIYATAGIGGNTDASPPPPTERHPGCVVPDKTKEGCFRLAISWAATPLGNHIFNNHLAPERMLPSNTQEYARFYTEPGGALFLMGHFIKASPPTELSRAIADGVDFIPLPANSPIITWMERH